MNQNTIKNRVGGHGSFRIIASRNGVIEKVSEWMSNLVVDAENTGLNLVRKALLGDTSIGSIEITTAEIGTGNATPTLADTDLEAPVLTGVDKATQEISDDLLILQFFIADTALAADNYTEFALRCGTRLFTRALIDPAFEKSDGQDLTVEYLISFNNEV